jgi:hypothetical protein
MLDRKECNGWSSACATKSGVPTKTKNCTSSAVRVRRPSRPCQPRLATWDLGRVRRKARWVIYGSPSLAADRSGFRDRLCPREQAQHRNPIGTHGLHPANVECPDCKAPAKWTNMVACVRRSAGDALGAGGSRRRRQVGSLPPSRVPLGLLRRLSQMREGLLVACPRLFHLLP